jgi:hypothetical protein
MEQEESVLTVVTTSPSSMRGKGESTRRVIEEGIPLDTLQQSFSRFLQSLRRLIEVDNARVGDFVLDEITLSAEIGGDGEFKLLGSGVGISASSGITFTLRRRP